MPKFGKYPIPFPHDRQLAVLNNARVSLLLNGRGEDAVNNPGSFGNAPAALAKYAAEVCVRQKATPAEKQAMGRDVAAALWKFAFFRAMPEVTINDLVQYVDPDTGATRTYRLVQRPERSSDVAAWWVGYAEEQTT